MAHCFYAEHFASATPGDTVSLSGAEAKHAVAVTRLRVGETVLIGNAAGLLCETRVTVADRAEVSAVVLRVLDDETHSPKLGLAQALAKGDRDELAVQASTELGVDLIVPFQAERSISRWNAEKQAKGVERWRTIAREAGKQSLRARVPEVVAPATVKGLGEFSSWRTLVLDPLGERSLADIELDDRDVLLVVGPEGGISDAEFDRLEADGAERVRLGPTVVRTSTAGPVAIAVLSARLGRWAITPDVPSEGA
ncbi:16S rRNA (uracil(1498)-N(3))-methyltransferase [Humidisolicoccus flavus]|uniref:16S rRNA (uracil(1498)-N(3))-methyltransferase n=1 Tax=Humidisolicoccus flavus TaxID=3111414 RepID=UPI00324B1471